MAFLNSLEQIRSIEWGSKYLWDIKFEGAPAPFDNWFPAQSVEVDDATLESHQFTLGLKDFKLPKRGTVHGMRITFHDDVRNTLYDWIVDWIRVKTLNNDQFVSTIDTVAKQVTVIKMNRQKETISTFSYWVYPETPPPFNGESADDVQSYSVPFVIVGEAGSRRQFVNP